MADALREYEEALRIKMVTLGKDYPNCMQASRGVLVLLLEPVDHPVLLQHEATWATLLNFASLSKNWSCLGHATQMSYFMIT